MKRIATLIEILFFSSFFLCAAANPTYTIEKSPSWNIKIPFEIPLKDFSKRGDATYLLVDFQENEIVHESTYHYWVRLNNEQGVQNNAQLSFSFDPSYQSLAINQITIHRGSMEISHLNRGEIELMRNEKNAEYLIYDGTYSAITILKDIRVGDILEYEYTIKGQNPIFANYIYSYISQAFGSEGGQKPVVSVDGKSKSLVWDIKNQAAIFNDANIPSWYDAYPACEVSSYKDWGEVKKWGRKLFPFEVEDNELNAILTERKFTKSEDGIIGVIRFVQDEIRYLGLETGIHSHQPHHPADVIKNRFGDCKDKSYLLAVLLRKLGVEAWPAYVHTSARGHVIDNAPSPFAFNHVIVKFIWDDKVYWVDPTENQQKGNLQLVCMPDYQMALVLDEDSSSLEDIPVSQTDRAVIREDLWFIDSISDVRYEVESIYYGNLANSKRSYHLGTPLPEIRENYLNYCSGYYNGLKWTSDSALQYIDYPDKNSFKVREEYLISGFFDHSTSDTVERYAQINPYNLYEFLSYSKDKARKMPLAVKYPISIDYTINMHFPKHKEIGFKGTINEIQNNVFMFSKNTYVSNDNRIYSLNYTYHSKKDNVPVEELTSYFKDYDKLSDLCIENIKWGMATESVGGINWISLVISLLFSIVLIGIFWLIYPSDLGQQPTLKNPIDFGGWLIFPIISLCFSPLLVAYQIINTGYFGQNLWVSFLAQNTDWPGTITFLFYFELLFNVSIILSSGFLLILMFLKRASFPQLYIGFRIFVMAGIILDMVISTKVVDPDSSTMNELVRTIIGSAIWIPYFSLSDRVKLTFVNTFRKPEPHTNEMTMPNEMV